ncbi:uncharacterized protein LOC111071504 [Drosophila obscura]|uniref:uncharacterized protein LOC111071504 n=1 Tax=Drosophila obscura TaxID=7282 RepID=UPI000BA11502|nr:uncharacterized protein LOC111071504 [Drosophila obscura]
MDLLSLNTLQNLSLLSQSVEQLNGLYGMELNVFLDFGNRSDSLAAIRQPSVASLWIRNVEIQLVLEGNFSSRTLTIVQLEQALLQPTLEYLTAWLWRYQHLQVLIVYTGATQVLLEIFDYCWKQGMVHILAVEAATGQLYSFMPYPKLRLLSLASVQAYYARTRGMLRNFQGHNITTGIAYNGGPRCFGFRDSHNRTILAGYMLHMVLEFIKHFNGTMQLIYITSVSQAIGLLTNRTIDLVPYLMIPADDLYAATNVLYLENCVMMVPSSRPLATFLYMVRPFTWGTWLTWLLILVYCSAALLVLSQGRLNPSAAFLEALCLSLFLGIGNYLTRGTPAPRGILIFVLLTASGFILTNLYLAQLSTSLAARLYEREINTVDDLPGTNLKWYMIAYDAAQVRSQFSNRPNVIKHILVGSNEKTDDLRRQLNTCCVHSGYEDRIDFILYQQKLLRFPIFRKLPEILYQQPHQIPASFGRPYLPFFNDFTLRIFESGIQQKMKSDSYRHGVQSGQIQFNFRDRYMEVSSNNLEYYYVIAGLWLGGMLLATISFLCEYYPHRKGGNTSLNKV